MSGIFGGGGGGVKVPIQEPKQSAVTAQPVISLLSEAEERNKKLAAALLTADWNAPPKLGKKTLKRNDLLGL